MRAFLAIIFCLSVFAGFSQNFVSPGIIAFHSGAYERTIEDMDKAFQTSSDMDNETRAKAFYYRGMARLKLAKAGSRSLAVGRDPYLTAYNDLNQAIQLDRQWNESSREEMSGIYQRLVASAKNLYDQGIYSNLETEVNNIFGSAILKLNAANQINNSYETNDLLGKVYDAMGVFYDQLIDNEEAQQKAISSYQSAMRFYESAVNINPRALENIRALKQLAYRLGDRTKEQKYAQMEASIGG